MVMFILTLNICLVLQQFLRIEPLTIPFEAAPLLFYISDFLNKSNPPYFVWILNAQEIIESIAYHFLPIFIIGMDMRVTPTLIQQCISQLGCPFKPSSLDIQSARLGFLLLNKHFILWALVPFPLIIFLLTLCLILWSVDPQCYPQTLHCQENNSNRAQCLIILCL